MRHMCSADAICPFYKCEQNKTVYCEGCAPGVSQTQMMFGSTAKKKKWQKQYCNGEGWAKCPQAQTIDKKYSDK